MAIPRSRRSNGANRHLQDSCRPPRRVAYALGGWSRGGGALLGAGPGRVTARASPAAPGWPVRAQLPSTAEPRPPPKGEILPFSGTTGRTSSWKCEVGSGPRASAGRSPDTVLATVAVRELGCCERTAAGCRGLREGQGRPPPRTWGLGPFLGWGGGSPSRVLTVRRSGVPGVWHRTWPRPKRRTRRTGRRGCAVNHARSLA